MGWLSGGSAPSGGSWLNQPVQKGKQYTSQIGPDPNAPKPERQVNPFVAYKERRDQALAKLRAPPGSGAPTSELCWGGPAQYSESPLLPTGGFNTRNPEDEEPEEPPEKPEQKYEWREQNSKGERKTENVQIASENDPETFIVVARIKEMVFTAPSPEPFNGRRHKFVFKHPTQQQEGQ